MESSEGEKENGLLAPFFSIFAVRVCCMLARFLYEKRRKRE